MKIKYHLIVLFVLSVFAVGKGFSAIYWVGNSSLCQGTNVRSSLNLALISAFVTSENDEIRLTDTMSFTGNLNGTATLTDYHPGVRGSITISGGYTDCYFGSNGNRTLMGNTSDNVINVNTSSQPSSIVTLKNLNLVGGAFRGINADGNVTITLDNVRIADNPSGMFVTGGAYVNMLANSIIENNMLNGNTGSGGGFECTGANSQVDVRGIIKDNWAQRGGNIYLRTGCYVELYGGARIEGRPQSSGGINAIDGGGVYVAAGGTLFSNGGANRVSFINNRAFYGGAIYIVDSGRATLLNTNITNSMATSGPGGVIYAANGGTATPQLVMDRVGPCPFGFSCSEIEGGVYRDSLIFANNSILEFNRTLIERSNSVVNFGDPGFSSIITGVNGGIIRLNRVGIINNESNYLLNLTTFSTGKIEVSHTTFAGNFFTIDAIQYKPWVTVNLRTIDIQNSIFANTRGTDTRGGIQIGRCNLVDDPGDMNNGYDIGTAIFRNLAAGDARQLSSSPGVDMCNEDTFGFTASNKDIEYQDSPVNDNINQQGLPGDVGGMFDAGFDEVYDNIGEDNFLLTVMKTGTGSGAVVSLPLGIGCGSDCNEVYFNGTNVELIINASSDSTFSGWSGCDRFPIDGNSCYVFMDQIRNVTITFTAQTDFMFADSFE